MTLSTFAQCWFGVGLVMVAVAIIRARLGKQGTDADALLGWSLFFAGPIHLIGLIGRQIRIAFPKK